MVLVAQNCGRMNPRSIFLHFVPSTVGINIIVAANMPKISGQNLLCIKLSNTTILHIIQYHTLYEVNACEMVNHTMVSAIHFLESNSEPVRVGNTYVQGK